MNNYLINKIHRKFIDDFNLSELDSMKLRYSLEVLINDTLKLLIIFSLFLSIGESELLFYSLITLMIIRPFTGGLHLKSFLGCLIFSIAFFFITLLLSTYITLTDYIVVILFIFVAFIIILYAPITSVKRPKYSTQKRLQFKLLSFVVILFHFTMYYLTKNNPYFNTSIWVISLQCIQLLITKGKTFYEKKKFNIQKI